MAFVSLPVLDPCGDVIPGIDPDDTRRSTASIPRPVRKKDRDSAPCHLFSVAQGIIHQRHSTYFATDLRLAACASPLSCSESIGEVDRTKYLPEEPVEVGVSACMKLLRPTRDDIKHAAGRQTPEGLYRSLHWVRLCMLRGVVELFDPFYDRLMRTSVDQRHIVGRDIFISHLCPMLLVVKEAEFSIKGQQHIIEVDRKHLSVHDLTPPLLNDLAAMVPCVFLRSRRQLKLCLLGKNVLKNLFNDRRRFGHSILLLLNTTSLLADAHSLLGGISNPLSRT